MSDLAGRHCVITGASRGLGAAIARAFHEHGAELTLVARSAESLESVRRSLPCRPNAEVHLMAADLMDDDAPDRIIEFARSKWRRLDVVVNNAAIQGPIGPLEQNDAVAWRRAVQVNLLAPVRLDQLAVPWMRSGGGGKLIHIAGGGATSPRPFFTAYAAAKAALVRFAECLAAETREARIDVNCVSPGAMRTTMLDEIRRAGAAAGPREMDAARKVFDEGGADPGRAAALCVLLASARSDGLSGKLISAVWDPWERLTELMPGLMSSDVWTLRRIVPEDRPGAV